MENQEKHLQELRGEIKSVEQRARDLQIATPEDYEGAGDILKEAKSFQKKVNDWFDPLVKNAHRAWKSLTEKRAETLQPATNVERILKDKMLEYNRKKAEEARKEQERLQAEAEAKARRERERLMKRAETLKTEEKRQQALQEAEQVQTVQVTVESEAPKQEGVVIKKTWKAKVVDQKQVIKSALEGTIPITMIVIDQSALNKFAQMTKGEINVPGVKFYQEESMTVKA